MIKSNSITTFIPKSVDGSLTQDVHNSATQVNENNFVVADTEECTILDPAEQYPPPNFKQEQINDDLKVLYSQQKFHLNCTISDNDLIDDQQEHFYPFEPPIMSSRTPRRQIDTASEEEVVMRE